MVLISFSLVLYSIQKLLDLQLLISQISLNIVINPIGLLIKCTHKWSNTEVHIWLAKHCETPPLYTLVRIYWLFSVFYTPLKIQSRFSLHKQIKYLIFLHTYHKWELKITSVVMWFSFILYINLSSIFLSSRWHFFLIGIYSMQGWTATTRHAVKRKRNTERSRHTRNLFIKNLQLKDIS